MLVILIRCNQRRLYQSQIRRRCHRTRAKILRKAIIQHIVIDTCKRHIEPCREIPQNIYIRIESHVEPVETSLFHRTLRIGIAHIEVIHTYVVTALHVDVIVLSPCHAIHLIIPVRIIMIHSIIIAVRIIIQEIEVHVTIFRLLQFCHCAKHLCCIVTPLRSIHHLLRTRL